MEAFIAVRLSVVAYWWELRLNPRLTLVGVEHGRDIHVTSNICLKSYESPSSCESEKKGNKSEIEVVQSYAVIIDWKGSTFARFCPNLDS